MDFEDKALTAVVSQTIALYAISGEIKIKPIRPRNVRFISCAHKPQYGLDAGIRCQGGSGRPPGCMYRNVYARMCAKCTL